MDIRIYPSVPGGTLSVPPSKSMAHRLLICAALAEGESVVENVALSDDIQATLHCLSLLGAGITVSGDSVTVKGCAGRPKARGLLPCGESGSTLRFLIPPALLYGGGEFMGAARLMERPLSVYEDLFPSKGIALTRGPEWVSVKGRLTAGDYSLPGDVSSQFLTGLLFALPLLEGDSRIGLTAPLESGSYVDLTLSALETFGIRIARPDENTFLIPGNQRYLPQTCRVEGDESNAAFLGALCLTGGRVNLTGRNPATVQGDRVWEEYFQKIAQGPCTLSVADCPDLAPVLMAVGALFRGCRLTDTRRLRLKESDRAAVMAEELEKFGVAVTVEENSVTVEESPLFAPNLPLCGHNDHRIVMALSVLASEVGGVIRGAEACRKSYPDFFEALEALNVRLKRL